MYGKISINIILIVLLAIIQLAFISALPGWLSNLNLILVVLVFILGLSNFYYALWWAIGSGVMLDIYSFLPFGAYLTSLTAAIFLINFLLNNFFTNRSLYSFFAMIFLASISYKIILYILSFIIYFIGYGSLAFKINISVLLNEAIIVGINILAGFVIYYFINLISARLKPVFLLKKKK